MKKIFITLLAVTVALSSSMTALAAPRTLDAVLFDPEYYAQYNPDVVAVPCWYGELKWDPDSWIMHWVEEEFGAVQVIDGSYFRYYIRRS